MYKDFRMLELAILPTYVIQLIVLFQVVIIIFLGLLFKQFRSLSNLIQIDIDSEINPTNQLITPKPETPQPQPIQPIK